MATNIKQIKYYFPLILVILYSLIRLSNFPIHDFTNLYFSGWFAVNGEFGEETYDAFQFNQQIKALGYENIFTGFYPNTPFIAFLIIPLTVLPLITAKYVFVFISLLLFVISLFRLLAYFNIPRQYLLFIPILFFSPIKNNILFGQAYFIVFFLLAEGYIQFKKEKFFLSGFLWSLAILLKIIPLFIIIFLILNRHWRTFSTMLVIGLFACISILLLFGFPFLDFYIGEVLVRSTSGELFSGFSPAAQSATFFFKNIFMADELVNPDPIYESIYGYHTIQIIYKFFVFFTCTMICIHEKVPTALKFSIWFFAGILFSPTLSTYAPIILVLPVLSIMSELDKHNRTFVFSIMLLTFLFCNFPLHWLPSSVFIFYFVRLTLLIMILGIIGFYYGSNIKFKIMGRVALFWIFVLSILTVPMILRDLPEEREIDSYLFIKDKKLLITDYGVENGYLFFSYWSRQGEQNEITDYRINSLDSVNVRLANNQIYYRNKQLTDSNDLKRLPKVVDDQWIIYLSDKNRGMGFYTLRKINL